MNKHDQEFMVQKIRTQYMEKESTLSELDELKKLDAQVKKPANIFAYTFGSISALVMGAGMSLVMTDIGSTIGINDPMVPGILIGVIGMILAIINYPIYKKILTNRKDKYAKQILELSDKIINK
ncbi:MAG: dihydropteridine reductase [Lachnospira sp.]|nr:dihydropteridine reductase [Lachnospira sp.]